MGTVTIQKLDCINLQSRYYSPEIGRLINADSTEILDNSGMILDNNLFVYCVNNPISNYDPTGYGYTDYTKPLNDNFLKNPDGSYITGEKLADMYKKEKDPAKKEKIKKQQKILKERDKQKRKENEKSKGKSKIGAGDVIIGVGLVIIGGVATAILVADDVTGIGVADDPLIAGTGGMVVKGLTILFRW